MLRRLSHAIISRRRRDRNQYCPLSHQQTDGTARTGTPMIMLTAIGTAKLIAIIIYTRTRTDDIQQYTSVECQLNAQSHSHQTHSQTVNIAETVTVAPALLTCKL